MGGMAEKSCGELLVERIVTDLAQHHLEPDQRDRELFDVIAEIRDEIEELKAVVESEGRTNLLKDGRPVVHGAVVELRLQRAALAKLLSGLSLDATGKNPVKQRAAITRWAAHNARKAAIYEGA
jgi:predicted kinase